MNEHMQPNRSASTTTSTGDARGRATQPALAPSVQRTPMPAIPRLVALPVRLPSAADAGQASMSLHSTAA